MPLQLSAVSLQQKFQSSEFLLLSFIQIPAVKTEHGPDGVEHEQHCLYASAQVRDNA